ncbi:reverse transcriptase domain-containing protein [Tanacetum coccineum]
MRDLREDTFSGNKNDDTYEHVNRVLDIVSLFSIPGVSHDAIMLRIFPITLTGATKIWIDRIPSGTINTWYLLEKAFIQRYCPPSKTLKQLEEIHNFKQEGDETLYQAWERYNGLFYRCPTHDLNSQQRIIHKNGMIDPKIEGQAVVAQMELLLSQASWIVLRRDMKKLKENVHAIQVGCGLCGGAHLDKECPLNEEVKGIEEVKYGEFGRSFLDNGGNGARYRHIEESTRRRNETEDWMKKLQENTNMNIRNQNAALKNLETHVEQLKKDFHAKAAKEAPNSSTLIGHCKAIFADNGAQNDEICSNETKELHIVSFISGCDVKVSKRENEGSSGVLPCQLPPKELNPGSFTLLCTICSLNMYALADLGASVNIVPYSMFKNLKLTNLKKTTMFVEMTDMSKKAPMGIVENVLVKIDKFIFPYDFVVIDMLGNPYETLILAFGWLLEEIHLTWAKLEKKRTRLRLYTNYLKEKHTVRGDGVANYK